MKKCCFPGCTIQVDKGHLACLPHWHQVSKIDRGQVQIRLRGWKDRPAAREYLVGVFCRQMRGQNVA